MRSGDIVCAQRPWRAHRGFIVLFWKIRLPPRTSPNPPLLRYVEQTGNAARESDWAPVED
jgi:hypothetical protein